jgi:hypothetical protein
MTNHRHTALARFGSLVVAGGAGAFVLGGFGGRPLDNGIGSLPPATAVAHAESALAKVNVFTLTGFLKKGTARIGYHIASSARGKRIEVSLDANKAAGVGFTGTMRLIRITNSYYIDGSSQVWKSIIGSSVSPAVLAVLSNRWIEMPTGEGSSAFQSFDQLASPGELAKTLLGAKNVTTLTMSRPTIYHHQSVVAITNAKAAGATLYIALNGQPLPVAAVATSSTLSEAFDFAYPKSLAIVVPPGAETLAQAEASLNPTTTTAG